MPSLSGMPSRFLSMMADEEGTSAIEYAFIVSLVSIAIGFMIPEIRAQLDELFLRTASGIGAAAAGSQSP